MNGDSPETVSGSSVAALRGSVGDRPKAETAKDDFPEDEIEDDATKKEDDAKVAAIEEHGGIISLLRQ